MRNRSPFVNACKMREMSAARLARLAGISNAYTQQMRRGCVPSAAVRARVALVLGLYERELWPDVVRDIDMEA
jgi:hypothetical protein